MRPTLTELRSGPQLAELAGGRLDIGFVFGTPPTEEFGHRPVLRTRLVAVVGGSHPLARQTSVTFAQLAEHPCHDHAVDHPRLPVGNAGRR
jgi:DNA-binding transcriptional LysR family regulator